jgi:hypothetical protein
MKNEEVRTKSKNEEVRLRQLVFLSVLGSALSALSAVKSF